MFITFILGVILGILIRDIKFETRDVVSRAKEKIIAKVKGTQFIEPVSFKEKWKSSKSVDDLLEK